MFRLGQDFQEGVKIKRNQSQIKLLKQPKWVKSIEIVNDKFQIIDFHNLKIVKLKYLENGQRIRFCMSFFEFLS